MIIVAKSKLQAEAISDYISNALRDKVLSQLNVTSDCLETTPLSLSGKTTAWDIPKQIDKGIYANWWYINCPMLDGKIREDWIYQMDPVTKKIRDRSVWEGSKIVKFDPSWFIIKDDEAA